MPTTIPAPTTHDDGNDAVMTRLRAARPRSAEDAEAFLALHGEDLLASILRAPSAHTARPASVVPLRRTTGRRVTRALVAAAAVAAVTITGTVLVQYGPSGLLGPAATSTATAPGTLAVTSDARAAATAPAGTVLLQLASAALQEPPASGNATVSYRAIREAAHIRDPRVLTQTTNQTWKAPDGSGRSITIDRSDADPTFDDSWGAGKSPDGGSWAAGQVRGLGLTSLSTDPAVLASQVADWAASQPLMTGNAGLGTVADTELDLLVQLLAEPSAEPALRAAAFTALAERDDVGLLGEHTDPLGRTGIAVEYDLVNGATWRVTLTFDPATSTLLAHESTLIDRGGQKWLDDTPLGPWSWTATTASGMVDAIGDTSLTTG